MGGSDGLGRTAGCGEPRRREAGEGRGGGGRESRPSQPPATAATEPGSPARCSPPSARSHLPAASGERGASPGVHVVGDAQHPEEGEAEQHPRPAPHSPARPVLQQRHQPPPGQQETGSKRRRCLHLRARSGGRGRAPTPRPIASCPGRSQLRRHGSGTLSLLGSLPPSRWLCVGYGARILLWREALMRVGTGARAAAKADERAGCFSRL